MNEEIKNDLSFLKNELESLTVKVDTILDILNNFTIMLMETEEDEDIYDTDDSWVPDQNDSWEDYEDLDG